MKPYTHPYKRGFSFGFDYEGFPHFWVLIWKWEFSWWPKVKWEPDFTIKQLAKPLKKREDAVAIREKDNEGLELEAIYSTRL
jgi:hypothetical protein